MKHITRRGFIKNTVAAAATLSLTGSCNSRQNHNEVKDKRPSGTMTYRAINGDKISLLGYGCMRWPMTENNGVKTIDKEMVGRLVEHAIAHGINYFDATPVYLQGECERATAEALSKYPRESYFIATKLSNFKNYSLEAGKTMYKESLSNFATDHIDYYLLHSVGGGGIQQFEERFIANGMMDFLLEERNKGHIRHLGFSFHGDRQTFDELMVLHERYHWDFVQIQLNYMDWKFPSGKNTQAEYLYNELTKRNIPIIVMEPLLGGRLADLPEYITDMLKTRSPQSSNASWAFRFAGTHANVACVLSGMTYMEHLQDNINTYSPLIPLTNEESGFLAEVATHMKKYPMIRCTSCDYCMPCPYGIDIPEIFKHYNKCLNEGHVNDKSGTPEYRKARRAYLVSYDRAIPKLRQADRCISCGQCSQKCPQGTNIPGELGRIWSYVEKLRRNNR